MANLRRLVLDVLKPHDPPLVSFTDQVAETDGVAAVTTSLVELDREVENCKLTVEGEDLSLEAVTDTIETIGGSVHSVDEVACGEHVVEDRPTQQDD